MFGLGPHWGFIVTAYGIAAAVLVGSLVWIRIDLARQRRALAELEAAGVRRRSERAAATPAATAEPAAGRAE